MSLLHCEWTEGEMGEQILLSSTGCSELMRCALSVASTKGDGKAAFPQGFFSSTACFCWAVVKISAHEYELALDLCKREKNPTLL